ncbi:hypothetical protein TNCV_1410311 [Trichonephila clavipes]|nr:hypothetical protein TNCV_1410311 [Trichonephila clavipes]
MWKELSEFTIFVITLNSNAKKFTPVSLLIRVGANCLAMKIKVHQLSGGLRKIGGIRFWGVPTAVGLLLQSQLVSEDNSCARVWFSHMTWTKPTRPGSRGLGKSISCGLTLGTYFRRERSVPEFLDCVLRIFIVKVEYQC